MSRRRDRRRAAYQDWCTQHSRDQAAAVCTTAVILGTMPNQPVLFRMLVRIIQRVAADLTVAVAEQSPGQAANLWQAHDG